MCQCALIRNWLVANVNLPLNAGGVVEGPHSATSFEDLDCCAKAKYCCESYPVRSR